MGCRGWPPRSWRSRLSRGAGPRCRGESPELAAGTAKGSASLQKVRMASPSCTPPRHSKRAPCPAPTPLSPTAAELKITSPVAPRRPRPRPLPRPSPTGRGAKPRLPVPPKRGGKKKRQRERKKEKAAREGSGGRAGGGGPSHMDVISPLRGRQAAQQRSAPARRPPGLRLPPSLRPPSLHCAGSFSRSPSADGPRVGLRGLGPPGRRGPLGRGVGGAARPDAALHPPTITRAGGGCPEGRGPRRWRWGPPGSHPAWRSYSAARCSAPHMRW